MRNKLSYPPPVQRLAAEHRISANIDLTDTRPEQVWGSIIGGVMAASPGADWRWVDAHPEFRFRIDPSLKWKLAIQLTAARAVLDQTGSQQATFLINGEISGSATLYRDGRSQFEFPRNPKWRLSVSHNPWEVQRAFDGALFSWWTSGQYAEPGMWIETDFGETVPVERIRIEQNVDQHAIAMHPAVAAGEAGAWRVPPFASTGEDLPAPGDIRMQVRDELKQTGIGWILLADGNPQAAAFRNDAPYWVISEIASNGFQL
jgi:hypothetical protein